MARPCQDISFGDAACNAREKSLHVGSHTASGADPTVFARTSKLSAPLLCRYFNAALLPVVARPTPPADLA